MLNKVISAFCGATIGYCGVLAILQSNWILVVPVFFGIIIMIANVTGFGE